MAYRQHPSIYTTDAGRQAPYTDNYTYFLVPASGESMDSTKVFCGCSMFTCYLLSMFKASRNLHYISKAVSMCSGVVQICLIFFNL